MSIKTGIKTGITTGITTGIIKVNRKKKIFLMLFLMPFLSRYWTFFWTVTEPYFVCTLVHSTYSSAGIVRCWTIYNGSFNNVSIIRRYIGLVCKKYYCSLTALRHTLTVIMHGLQSCLYIYSCVNIYIQLRTVIHELYMTVIQWRNYRLKNAYHMTSSCLWVVITAVSQWVIHPYWISRSSANILNRTDTVGLLMRDTCLNKFVCLTAHPLWELFNTIYRKHTAAYIVLQHQ